MQGISFENHWLLLLVPLVCLLFLIKRRGVYWVGHQVMLTRPLGFIKRTFRKISALTLLLAFVFAIIAWANPTQGKEEKVTKVKARQVCMAVDISGSMFGSVSYEIQEKRIQVAAKAGNEFVDARAGDMFSFVPFDDKSRLGLSVPLTFDRELIKKQFQAVADGQSGGSTAIGEGIWSCMIFLVRDALPKKFSLDIGQLRRSLESEDLGPYATSAAREIGCLKHAFITVLTDGESNAGINPLRVLAFAGRLCVKVYTIAATPERYPDLIRAVEKTGGQYFFARDIQESKRFYSDINRIEKKEVIVERETRARSLRWYFSLASALSLFVFGVFRLVAIKVP
ncbi:hypothetical protein A2833_03030 [Candidatus Azambacteria bacterium RIFCSPHIGHO2_01_FULL_44_55]|uniref:VWFA domain-containing protein n=1 Tax=Candidatus Azambacteria bacterium RIFCSPLOWO2_02_FULL_44_14 TaxID=1797306 RepID=A0A1F5CBC6_9BACT|nr:MAG: hypothetical protein A3A18_02345 [Candidatus Azambacteria bacterium RIFCSPLOWO2_01_FULL_44_84]OGD33066.1 MAG: hypothetical protein A3C78_01670 [Candidatus Azambacteria bacterium RIFCSPHIGHO2_02_FULL_45_18]OGD40157.1 MAG: hypothetical protein A3I30_02725 [Candidatus Azambacteria bacterium RIFCSPLOWO2_02_FULL_44_14]OGD41689.1 MAG: hypothetical protein A2833_03030 [Candidatus Azambacteria bacterium RIFCSPHIGHO2_01_FULL_44_55]OGD49963.1 MAG: hypothetical protein A2608_01135 [Candidatus Azam